MASSASIVYGEVLEAVLSPKQIGYELAKKCRQTDLKRKQEHSTRR